jgi:S1-C subfamily serine protease
MSPPEVEIYTCRMTLSESTRGVLASLSDDLVAAVAHAAQFVVAVDGRRRLPASGIAWTSSRVLTAAHVLERDHDLSIIAPDGQRHPARLVAGDASIDLAILAVDGEPLQPADRNSGGPLLAGHLVLAVGRPGTQEPIASFGAISSSGGAWRTAQGGMLDAYIRADVSLLPGLSGGALVTSEGTLIGMLSAHLAGGDPVAIPTPSLDSIVTRLLSGGSVRRAYLGVSTQPVELQASLRTRLDLTQSTGLMLLGLEPGAPAEAAGLLLGDIILAIGERTIEDGEALQMALGPEVVSQPVAVRIIRGGLRLTVTVTPAPRPS